SLQQTTRIPSGLRVPQASPVHAPLHGVAPVYGSPSPPPSHRPWCLGLPRAPLPTPHPLPRLTPARPEVTRGLRGGLLCCPSVSSPLRSTSTWFTGSEDGGKTRSQSARLDGSHRGSVGYFVAGAVISQRGHLPPVSRCAFWENPA